MASLGMSSLSIGGQPAGYEIGDAFHHVHMSIIVAARAAGILAIDGPYAAIRDLDGFRTVARRSAALGYDGKWVLHPRPDRGGQRDLHPRPEPTSRRRSGSSTRTPGPPRRPGGAVGAITVDDEMVDEASIKVSARIVAKRAAGLDTPNPDAKPTGTEN